ncbi:MAG: hypothetical protein WC725_02250 [Patescibacteria group bacterium]|jgi:hypothetical protein
MKFSNLFYSTYWFKQPVIAVRNVYYFWLVSLIVLAGVGLGCLIAEKFVKNGVNKKILDKFGDLFSSMGIAGLVLFFFRQQSVPLLGYRVWFLAWGVVFVIWLGVILKYVILRVPKVKAEQAEKARIEKYLP